MSSAQYRRLLTNLPSMAVVVNSFQSSEVQLAVYRTLMESLMEATADDPPAPRSAKPRSRPLETDITIAVGDSIHSIAVD